MMVPLTNATPFTAESFVLPDADCQETLLVVLVAVFVDRGGRLELADEQRPVRVADVHHGEPGASSVRYEAELALDKPRVDVLLNGRAYAPGGRPVQRVSVELLMGAMHK